MKKLIVMSLLLLTFVSFAAADVYVKSKVHSDPMSIMGQSQPAQDSFSEQWIGEDRFAVLSEKTSTIVDLKKNVLYLINNKAKTYIEAPLPFDFASILPTQMATMMSSMMKMTVTVAPTGQKKTVGTWNCDEYDITMNMMMMPVKMKAYTTSDVPFNLKDYMEKVYANTLKAQFRLDDASTKEMMKVQGFWIASDTTMEMMGAKIHSTTEVVEISSKTPPSEVYMVPDGFTKQDKLSMQDLQQR